MNAFKSYYFKKLYLKKTAANEVLLPEQTKYEKLLTNEIYKKSRVIFD